MPDTKFTWRGLREHLRKYFWIYLIGIVVCLVGTDLIWTTTRPRVPSEQGVTVFLCDGYVNYEPLEDIAADMLLKTQQDDPTLLKVEFQNLQYAADDYASSMLLVTRLAVGEGDAFIACEAAMDALVKSQALEPLDDYVAGGWLEKWNLPPYYATLEDEETGESTTFLAGLKLDQVAALGDLGAINPQGAVLCLTTNGGNTETTMKALEYMIEDLMEAGNAATEATEPSA